MGQSRDEPGTVCIADSLTMQFTTTMIVVSIRAVWSAPADEEIRGAVRRSLSELPSHQRWNVVVDLQEIEVISSSVLGLLVMFWSQANRSGGKMAISNVSDLVYEKMQQMNLADLWYITGSQKDAILVIESTA